MTLDSGQAAALTTPGRDLVVAIKIASFAKLHGLQIPGSREETESLVREPSIGAQTGFLNHSPSQLDRVQ